jgi:glycerate 2-kinase
MPGMDTHLLKHIFLSAVASCRPDRLLPGVMNLTPDAIALQHHQFNRSETERLFIIAAGKAAAALAVEAEKILGPLITDGLCVTKYHHGLPLSRIRMIEAAHPEPDENSLRAGNELIRMLQGLTKNDLVILLISGGASSLLTDLPEEADNTDLKEGYRLLINSGASIHEINCIRKHLSRIKGGQLVRIAHPAKVVSLLISDVPGDDPQTIGSGLTVPDPTTYQDAIHILTRFNLLTEFPVSLLNHLKKGSFGLLDETPKPGDPVFQDTYTDIIANNQLAVETAVREAQKMGFHIWRNNNIMTGNTDEEALAFSRQMIKYDGPLPALFISGGETTIRVTGHGKGGRNQHFALRILQVMKTEWNNNSRFVLLSAGTDGTDGPTNAAGAIIDSAMLSAPAITLPLIKKHLDSFNAYPFFATHGGLLITGPTQTNVMDLVIGIKY